MTKAIEINHVTVLTKNKERARDFYIDTLRLEDHTFGENNHFWVKVGKQYIHISESSGSPVANTFYHFAISVDGLQEYLKTIIEKGVEVFELDDEMKPTNINQGLDKEPRQYFVHDPDGNLVELIDKSNSFFH